MSASQPVSPPASRQRDTLSVPQNSYVVYIHTPARPAVVYHEGLDARLLPASSSAGHSNLKPSSAGAGADVGGSRFGAGGFCQPLELGAAEGAGGFCQVDWAAGGGGGGADLLTWATGDKVPR